MIFKRKKYLDKIYSSLKKNEKLIIIYWARQVWKTTLLKILMEDKKLLWIKKYINFDDIYERNFKNKDEFMNFFAFNYWIEFEKEWYLFLDEVQTVENIEQILKSLYDDDKIKLKVIVTWSWLWQIKKIGSSLVGRVKQIWIYPFSFFEFLEYKKVDIKYLNFEKYSEFMFEKIEPLLKEYYTFWWYPAVILEKTKKEKIEKLSEIIDIYLKKDISFFLSWSELISFKKIFVFLATNISSSLNITKLSDYLWISRLKTEKYLEVLEKSFLLHKVYPFYLDPRKEYSKQTEFFLNDLWIINYFRNNFNFIDFDWNLIENFVYLELLKNKYIFSDEIKTYNKINWSEIDFIYESKIWKILPIEVKLNNWDTIPKIFNSFSENYWEKIDYLYRTSTSIKKERILNFSNKKFTVKILPFFLIWSILYEVK